MGRSKNSGLSLGAYGQTSIENYELNGKLKEQAESVLTSSTQFSNDSVSDADIKLLDDAKVKYNKDDVLFVSRDSSGQLVWLEKGNPSVGLEHILNGDGISSGHASQFEKALKLKPHEVSSYLKKVVTNGTIVNSKLKIIGNRKGYEKTYYYEGNYCIVTAIGTNGFIVSAYPHRKGDK